jgi:hypothetical protein
LDERPSIDPSDRRSSRFPFAGLAFEMAPPRSTADRKRPWPSLWPPHGKDLSFARFNKTLVSKSVIFAVLRQRRP